MIIIMNLRITIDLGHGNQTVFIYRAVNTLIDDGIPFEKNGYYVMNASSTRIKS